MFGAQQEPPSLKDGGVQTMRRIGAAGTGLPLLAAERQSSKESTPAGVPGPTPEGPFNFIGFSSGL